MRRNLRLRAAMYKSSVTRSAKKRFVNSDSGVSQWCINHHFHIFSSTAPVSAEIDSLSIPLIIVSKFYIAYDYIVAINLDMKKCGRILELT